MQGIKRSGKRDVCQRINPKVWCPKNTITTWVNNEDKLLISLEKMAQNLNKRNFVLVISKT